MPVPKYIVQKLAKEWLAEAKRMRSRIICDCGCGQAIAVSSIARFKPGHDAKLLRKYREKINAILSGAN
jgi:hypothetical protein